eukprot:CAMPEP_0115323662 /NCGR_PEP_ID=MMETSP0270-20121206/82063_1 /TAXON_ID=71861 /ORGANISM="Scrippsiella trochoidea, Strain CCMP3099" /LENGTH=52 /DNA_ID=CAMNT_0002743725 /DNA_START=759 /DNA_END=914 /DNA_ORIENTATION=+
MTAASPKGSADCVMSNWRACIVAVPAAKIATIALWRTTSKLLVEPAASSAMA